MTCTLSNVVSQRPYKFAGTYRLVHVMTYSFKSRLLLLQTQTLVSYAVIFFFQFSRKAKAK